MTTAADDAIGQGQRKRGPAPDERTEAADWLREQLADGPRAAKEIIDDGGEIGFTKRTLYRAFREIGGTSTKSGFPAVAVWSASCANVARHKQPGTTDETWHDCINPEEEEEEEEIPKFLSNRNAVVPSSESVARLTEFEVERIELSNGNGHGEPPF